MSTAIGKRASTALKISSETTQLRRRVARADALFSEGLARLQSEYKARLRQAVLGEDEDLSETPVETPAPEQSQESVGAA